MKKQTRKSVAERASAPSISSSPASAHVAAPANAYREQKITLHKTIAKEWSRVDGFGMRGSNGIFAVTPGVRAYDALEAAQNLLCSASEIVSEGVATGEITASELHLIGIALGMARALHASIGAEV